MLPLPVTPSLKLVDDFRLQSRGEGSNPCARRRVRVMLDLECPLEGEADLTWTPADVRF